MAGIEVTETELVELRKIGFTGKNLISVNGNTVRIAKCNLCGKELDSESGKYRRTKHMQTAIDEHVKSHRA